MEVWTLVFYLAFGRSFEGGQYQFEEQCEQAARLQLENKWREMYGYRIGWRCELGRVKHG